jgi:hypothetical protein
MPGEMDLNICINKIYPGAKYRLSKSDPPHKIIEWRDARPQPTVREIEDAWEAHKGEVLAEATAIDNFRMENAEYEVLLPSGEFITLYLRKVTA